MAIISTLLSKLTLAYITEVVTISAIKQSTTAAIKSVPKVFSYLKGIISDTQIPIDNHLEKAIKKSQWLALKVIVKKMYEKEKLKGSYTKVDSIVIKIINLIDTDKYEINDKISAKIEIDQLLQNNRNEETLVTLQKQISELFLEELDFSTENLNKQADYNLLKDYVANGWEEENLNWFDLMIGFLKELLSGNDNLAKDAFQNQTLSKIKLKIEDFYYYADQCIKNIGSEIFEEFQRSFNEIKSEISDIKLITAKFSESLEELSARIIKPINLDLFPEPKALANRINVNTIKIKSIEVKINETRHFLKGNLTSEIKNRFEKDLEDLENTLLLELNQLKETEEDLERIKSYIQEAWKAINAVNNVKLEKAKTALENGNLKILEDILKEEDIDNEFDEIIQQEKNLTENKEILAQKYLTRGFIILAIRNEENWLRQATRNFEKASNISLNPNTLFDIANFYKDYNLPYEAIKIYNKSIISNPEPLIKSQIYNNLGIIYKSLDDFKNGEQAYIDSINIKRILSKEKPEENLVYLANSYMNFGVFYSHYGKNEQARNNFHESLEILECLRNKFYLEYTNMYGDLFNNIGRSFQIEQKLDEAETAYLESIRLKRNAIADSNNILLKISLTNSLVNFGNFCINKNQLKEAFEYLKEAYSLLELITKEEPYKFESKLGICMISLGTLYETLKDPSNSMKCFKKALQIFLRINYNGIFNLNIAATYSNIAVLNKEYLKIDYQKEIIMSEELLINLNSDIAEVKNVKLLNKQLRSS